MTRGRTSFSSHEEGIPHHEAYGISRPRHRSRQLRARYIRVGFYALLILLNFAILSLFGPGGITGDLLRFLERTMPSDSRAAVTSPSEAPSQFPPGESWDNGVTTTGQSISQTR